MNYDNKYLQKVKKNLNSKVDSQISSLEEFAKRENLDVEWVLEMFTHKFTCRVNEKIGARNDIKRQ